MASMRPRAPVLPKVVAGVSVLVLAAGSVLVFLIPPKAIQVKAVSPEPTASFSTLPDPRVTHDLQIPGKPIPRKTPSPTKTVKPSPRSTGKPSPVPTVPRTPVRRDPSSAPVNSPSPRPVVTPTPTTKPAPTTPKPTPTLTSVQPVEAERRAQVIYLINQQRAQAGLPDLSSSSRISDHCQEWAAHLASTGRLVYSPAPDEIIATGTTAGGAIAQWMNDSTDSSILLNPNLSRVGSGYVNGYWVVQFG